MHGPDHEPRPCVSLVMQVLKPLQSAWALLKAMPEHCDVMALFNAIHAVYS